MRNNNPRDYSTDPLAPHPETVRNMEELNRAMGIPNESDRSSGVVPIDATIYGDTQSDAAEAYEKSKEAYVRNVVDETDRALRVYGGGICTNATGIHEYSREYLEGASLDDGNPLNAVQPSVTRCVRCGYVLGDEAYEPNIVAEDLVRINDSGIVPTEFKVLVLPDESETQIRARRANIAVPDSYAAMYAHGSVTGTIIAMSPAAFSYHDWPEGCRIPLVGERIVFARYAGMLVAGKSVRNERGHDEPREYRLLNDKDIAAVLEF